MRTSDPGRLEFRPERYDQQHAQAGDPIHDPTEQFQTCGIGPMCVLKDHQQRTTVCQRLDLQNECVHSSLPALLRSQLERGIASAIRERQHLGKKRHVLTRGRCMPEQRGELVEPRLRRVVVRKVRRSFHLPDNGMKRAVRALGGREIAQARVRLANQAFQQGSRKSRFADTGLAREQHHLAVAGRGPGPALEQQFGFFFPPHDGSQAGPVERLKSALHKVLTQRRPGSDRPGQTLEIPRSEVRELE